MSLCLCLSVCLSLSVSSSGSTSNRLLLQSHIVFYFGCFACWHDHTRAQQHDPLQQPQPGSQRLPTNTGTWQRTRVLLVDEVSMVEAGFFDQLEETARRIRGNSRPFGGLQLVLVGDFFQLPPVSRGRAETKFCFQAKAWSKCIHRSFHLKQVHHHCNYGSQLRNKKHARRGTPTHARRDMKRHKHTHTHTHTHTHAHTRKHTHTHTHTHTTGPSPERQPLRAAAASVSHWTVHR